MREEKVAGKFEGHWLPEARYASFFITRLNSEKLAYREEKKKIFSFPSLPFTTDKKFFENWIKDEKKNFVRMAIDNFIPNSRFKSFPEENVTRREIFCYFFPVSPYLVLLFCCRCRAEFFSLLEPTIEKILFPFVWIRREINRA